MALRTLMNKKAAEGFTLPVLLGLILGLVALVVVIIGFSKGWSYVFNKMGLLPDDLTGATAACKTYAEGGEALALSFCEFRSLRIDGVRGYYNCYYVHDAAERVLGAGKAGYTKNAVSCGDSEGKLFCNKSYASSSTFKVSTMVNGKACSEMLQCAGTATLCTQAPVNVSETSCKAQKDCSWANNACGGTAALCNSIQIENCRAQHGCGVNIK